MMFLLAAPTKKELDALTAGLSIDYNIVTLVSGVGVLESSLALQQYLSGSGGKVEGVVLAGIGGAYSEGNVELLDICLATKEILGDLGVCYPDRIEPLDDSFAPLTEFPTDTDLFSKAGNILSESAIKFHEGAFVTVSSVSGSKGRGDYLRTHFNAICENMEGAAIARTCQEFNLPWIEIRCISNMVLDRADQRWDIDGAISRCSETVGILMEQLAGGS